MDTKTIPKKNSIAEVEISYKPNYKLSGLPTIQNSQEVYNIFLQTWDKRKLEFLEQFKVMLLNRANRVLGVCTIATGNDSGAIADPRIIFAVALKCNACNIILAHNHPSGRLVPSNLDSELTQRISEGGKLLNVKVLDHLIVSTEGYYSFADEGAI